MKVDIEKLLYKKPELNIGLSSLYRVHNSEGMSGDDGGDMPLDPDDPVTPITDSTGTGGGGRD